MDCAENFQELMKAFSDEISRVERLYLLLRERPLPDSEVNLTDLRKLKRILDDARMNYKAIENCSHEYLKHLPPKKAESIISMVSTYCKNIEFMLYRIEIIEPLHPNNLTTHGTKKNNNEEIKA